MANRFVTTSPPHREGVIALPNGKVDLWTATPSTFLRGYDPQHHLDTLDESERSRFERFRFARHRELFLCAHLLVRHALSLYHRTGPADWRFETNTHGHPRVIKHPLEGRLKFNLSHTDGLAVCAIAADRDIGVDVEHSKRTIDLRVAHRFFSPRETFDLMQLPSARRSRRFLELWTLKEAYIKARGLGLALPLRHFSLTGVDTRFPSIEFDAAIEDCANLWFFERLSVGTSHLLGVATGATMGTRPAVSIRPIEHIDELPR